MTATDRMSGTDLVLLERARAGDSRALDTLLDRHQAEIYRFGLAMCRNPEDAKDVLQDTLFAMARGVRDFRGASSISTWLYAVARSFCIKKRRRRTSAPAQVHSLESEAAPEAARIADAARTPEEILAGKQVERALGEAIGSLEPMYREVLLLRDVEGLSAAQAAEVLGISVHAVKSRLHRARLSVRASIAPLLGIRPDASAGSTDPCPDIPVLFSKYLEGEISADRCARMERHLDGCARCRGACASLKQTLALCRTSASAVAVPPAVQASVRVALRRLLGQS